MSTDPLLRDTPGIGDGTDVHLLLAALVAEREGQRCLIQGNEAAARPYLRAAAAAYLASYAHAPPRSWGRLIGAVKASVLADEGPATARVAADALGGVADSPASCYLAALCALVAGDDDRALRHAPGMREGGDAFARAADAVEAIARGDAEALERTRAAMDADFAARDAHLTGVPIADTSLMMRNISRMRRSGKDGAGQTP